VIVVKVELWSARTGKKTELGRMYVCNDGKNRNPNRGNYDATICRKGKFELEDLSKGTRRTHLNNWPSSSKVIWRLILRLLMQCYPEELP
jgi:hypothetical protein